jgi:hypothetical protein
LAKAARVIAAQSQTVPYLDLTHCDRVSKATLYKIGETKMPLTTPEFVSLGLAGVVFAHASYKAIYQSKAARKLAERELRWKQSDQARLVLNEMEDDEYAAAAMLMLDYSDRAFEIKGECHHFGWAVIDRALRTGEGGISSDGDLEFTDDEILIRDCYDHFFYHLERLQLWCEVDLISIYDIVFPIGYLADCMADALKEEPSRKDVFNEFLKAYKYHRSQKLLGNFESWGGTLTTSSQIPQQREPNLLDRLKEIILFVELPSKLDLAKPSLQREDRTARVDS